MQFQKVAVTGGSGRLGKFVVDALKDHVDVTVFDLRPPEQDVPYVECSILDYDKLLAALEGHDAVVHLAAIPNPRTAPAPVTFNTNVQGTWNIFDAAEKAGIRRVSFASSDAATGLHYNPENWSAQYLPIDEEHPLRPVEFYGLSKQVSETIARSYANRGKMQVFAIRPTHIVFEPEWPELEARGADIQNYHLWAYVEPEDVAQAFRLTLEYDGDARYDAFFISAADTLSTRPTLELMRERTGSTAKIARPDLFESLPSASIFDITHARDVLGFEPKSDWRAMVARRDRA